MTRYYYNALAREQLERTRELMNAHVRDCLVIGHERLVSAVELPDPDDRHVLAAAIKSGADNRARHAAGCQRIPASVTRFKRRVVKPFAAPGTPNFIGSLWLQRRDDR